MTFAAPEGTALVAPLATGTVFQVALVRDRGDVVVCKRLLPRMRGRRRLQTTTSPRSRTRATWKTVPVASGATRAVPSGAAKVMVGADHRRAPGAPARADAIVPHAPPPCAASRRVRAARSSQSA